MQSTKVQYTDIISYGVATCPFEYGLGYRCTGNGKVKRMSTCGLTCSQTMIEIQLNENNDIYEFGCCCKPRYIVISTDDEQGLLNLLRDKCGESPADEFI